MESRGTAGWALVGDAAYNRDPITAQGISDAFMDAEVLATALGEGWSGRRELAEAFPANHTTRDRRVKPSESLDEREVSARIDCGGGMIPGRQRGGARTV